MTEEENVVVEETTVVLDEPVEVILVDVSDARSFMTTPLNDYTVTEGLLLLILIMMIVKFVAKAVREGFRWLLP